MINLQELEKFKFEKYFDYYPVSIIKVEDFFSSTLENKYFKKYGWTETFNGFDIVDDKYTSWQDRSKIKLIKDDEVIREMIRDSRDYLKKGSKELNDILEGLSKIEIKDYPDILKKIRDMSHRMYETDSIYITEMIHTEDEELPAVRTEISDEFITPLWKIYDLMLDRISEELKIERKLCDWMITDELISLLEDRNSINLEDIGKRVIVAWGSINGTNYMLFNEEAKKVKDFMEKESKVSSDISEISGQVTYKSEKVSGEVIVLESVDYNNTEKVLGGKKDYILVTPMTRPEIIQYMKQAKAFVTDEGGITCHAAIVSRELKKPCIVGTKIATQVLKDGDIVEVDTDKGLVKIIT